MTMTVLPVAGRAAPAPVPAAYAAAAKAKLDRDRKSYLAFRAVDQQEHERGWKRHHDGAVARAEQSVNLYGLNTETLETETAAAREASRAAEDRARDAREYARTREAEAERLRDTGSAEEATDAQMRADTADGIAAEREADATRAREVLEGLERDLAEARAALETAERELRAARKAAGTPAGTAPISDATVQACAAFMQTGEIWGQLARNDRFRVHQAGQPRDLMSNEEWWAMVRGPGGSAV